MEVLHSMTTVGVRRGSFSCLGDVYALISEYSLWGGTRSRITVYLPLEVDYGGIKGKYFDIPFVGDGACLLEANDPYFVVATVSGDVIEILNVQRDGRLCKFGKARVYNHDLKWRHPCEMYRIDSTHFCVRIDDNQGMILKAQDDFDMRLVPWAPQSEALDACKTLYRTLPSTRVYIVQHESHSFHGDTHYSFRVECVELPWTVTARGCFVAACVL